MLISQLSHTQVVNSKYLMIQVYTLYCKFLNSFFSVPLSHLVSRVTFDLLLQGQWFYSLLAALEKPLLPESCSLIRSLARVCSNLRASLVSDISLPVQGSCQAGIMVIVQDKEGILPVATLSIVLYVLRRSRPASDVASEVAILLSAL